MAGGAHADFHRLLGDYVDNGVLRAILSAINRVIDWHTGLEPVEGEPELEKVMRAHTRITDAIAAGDEERAAAAMTRHLEGWEALMRRQKRLDEPILPRSLWIAHLRRNLTRL